MGNDIPWDHSKITYYLGDERCAPPDNSESNYGTSIAPLFPQGVPTGCKIGRMKGEANDRVAEANRYGNLLPVSIDFLLLSVGFDGHVASLFQGSNALNEMEERVVPVVGLKPLPERLTITPKVTFTLQNRFFFLQRVKRKVMFYLNIFLTLTGQLDFQHS